MAKRSGLGERFYVCQVGSGPAYDLSGDIGAIDSASSTFGVLDTTGINETAMDRLPGLGDGACQFTSFHNVVAGGAHKVLSLTNGLQVRAMWLGSATEGDGLAYVINGIQDTYPGTRAANGSLTYKPAIKNSNGNFPDWARNVARGTDASGANNHTAVDFRFDPSQPILTITGNTKAVTSEVTTSVNHGYTTGDTVHITSSNSTVSINGDWVITVTAANKFTILVDTSGGASAGTAGFVEKTSLRLGCILTAFLFSIGSGTNYKLQAQHSADNGVVDTYANITGVVTSSLTAAAAESRVRSGAVLIKPWVRVVSSGTYTNAVVAATFKRIAGPE